jgi:hypothetical protein
MKHEVNLTVKFKLDSEEQAKLMKVLLDDWVSNGLFEKDLWGRRQWPLNS